MKYLTKKQAAEYLTIDIGVPTTVKTLSVYITTGAGPQYHKFGNRVFYTIDSLNDWVASKMTPALKNSCNEKAYNEQ